MGRRKAASGENVSLPLLHFAIVGILHSIIGPIAPGNSTDITDRESDRNLCTVFW